jgi:hypothetical protein
VVILLHRWPAFVMPRHWVEELRVGLEITGLGEFELVALLGLHIEQGSSPSLSASDKAIPTLEL